MARTKNTNKEEITNNITNTEIKEEAQSVKEPETTAKATGPSYDDLLAIVHQLTQEVASLKASANTSSSNNGTAEILSKLANRKSDREVSIVHNCEMNGGLTTHMDLNGVSIDFSHVGETRLLSWQQFEECISKYRSFFDRKVVLMGPEYKTIADSYGLPCYDSTKKNLTPADIANLPVMNLTELKDFVESLTEDDKDTIYSYWLGKAYEKAPGFYDRAKIEMLNRASEGKFSTLLLVMNGDELI